MNVMNAFGERQHPEKFIPLCINKVLRGEEITIHAYRGAERPGSRWYIHARNIAAAVLFVLEHGISLIIKCQLMRPVFELQTR